MSRLLPGSIGQSDDKAIATDKVVHLSVAVTTYSNTIMYDHRSVIYYIPLLKQNKRHPMSAPAKLLTSAIAITALVVTYVVTDGEFPFNIFLPLIFKSDSTTSSPEPVANPQATSTPSPISNPQAPPLPVLDAFVTSVMNGQANVLQGVYVPGVLALTIEQQPESDPGYISTRLGVATQFRLASSFGVKGLLAHNFASGADFFNLTADQEVYLVYGDGTVNTYAVTQNYRFQALDPNSPSSQFVNLEDNTLLSAADVFVLVYTGDDHVTFQTCINNDGLSTWGRLFVMGMPWD